MKKIMILSLALIMGAMSFNSCKKYEEGPGISLRSKTGRLTGEWKMVKQFDSGIDVTSIYADEVETFEFVKGGDFIHKITEGNEVNTQEGKWEWGDKKESVKVSFQLGSTTFSQIYTIVQLKNKEMVLEGINFVFGDTFRYELEKQ